MRVGRKRRGVVFTGVRPPKVKRRHITKGDLWVADGNVLWVWRGYFRGWHRIDPPSA
jgi:hypothetical protein